MTQIVRTAEEQKRADEIFDSFRDELLKRELSNTESYDRAILTLSASSLGLSLTAMRFMIPPGEAEYLWLIVLGWFLLLASVAISLVAYLTSNKAIHEQLKNGEDYYSNGVEEAFNRRNKFKICNDYLNKLTGILFIVAITSIVIFVVVNLNPEI